MFRASLICLSKDIIKQANSVIYKFIWKGTDKIKRLAIISDYKNGGLRMPHIETLIDTQRIMCLKKTFSGLYFPMEAHPVLFSEGLLGQISYALQF